MEDDFQVPDHLEVVLEYRECLNMAKELSDIDLVQSIDKCADFSQLHSDTEAILEAFEVLKELPQEHRAYLEQTYALLSTTYVVGEDGMVYASFMGI